MRKLSLVAAAAASFAFNAYAAEPVHFPADGFVFKAGSNESCFVKYGDTAFPVASNDERTLVQVIHLDQAGSGRCASGQQLVVPTVDFERFEAAFQQRVADESRRVENVTKLLGQAKPL